MASVARSELRGSITPYSNNVMSPITCKVVTSVPGVWFPLPTGTLGGKASQANAVNNQGHVVGASEDRNRLCRGFFANEQHMWDINLLVKRPRNWFVSEAMDINLVGEILAMARNPQGVLQPVRLIPMKR